MDQRLLITEVDDITEPEPALVEIAVKLQDGTKASLRMNVFVAQKLAATIASIGG